MARGGEKERNDRREPQSSFENGRNFGRWGDWLSDERGGEKCPTRLPGGIKQGEKLS